MWLLLLHLLETWKHSSEEELVGGNLLENLGPYCVFRTSLQVRFTLPEGSKRCVLEEIIKYVCLYLGRQPVLSVVYWILGWGGFNMIIRTSD